MNFKVSHLLLLVSLCHVSAVSKASKVEQPNRPTEDDGIWIKKPVQVLLQGDAGAPASSTEAPTPPTTEAPQPVEDKGNWVLNYTKSAVFARLEAAIKLKISYNKSVNESRDLEVQVPANATVTGNTTAGLMTLIWPSKPPMKKNDTLTFSFTLITAKNVWQVVNVTGSVWMSVFNKTKSWDISLPFYTNKTSFNARVGMSYMCLKSDQYDVNLGPISHTDYNFTSAALVFSKFQIEAFKKNETNNIGFGSANNCELTPDMVPIAVGCALAGLVVIVLVAYLIAQRKPPAQGYRSV